MGLGIFDDRLGKPALSVGTGGIALAIDERPIVLDQALEGFPREVQPVEKGIAALEPRDDAKRLGIVVEPAMGLHEAIEFALAGMAEGRVAEIMGKRQGLGQILIEPERSCDRARHLGDLKRMAEPRPVVIAIVVNEYLGFVLQPAEGRGVNDAVAIASEGAAWRTFGLGHQPATAVAGPRCVNCLGPIHPTHR